MPDVDGGGRNSVESRVNDFAFKIGTVNGTGSASANSLLMQAIFRMGIPVTGKNVFPSNIQGLPTWYEIRVSREGYMARPADIDLVVALNPATYAKDVAAVRPGGYLLYDSSWPLDDSLVREGITILGIPFGKMCVESFEGDRERTLLRNIVYAGALVALLEIDMDVIGEMLREKFSKKAKLLDANFKAIRLGYDYAKANYDCPLPFRLERMNATSESILIDGNSAAALGAVFAGATVGAWYPITPSTSLMEAFKEYCERFRVDPTTKQRKYALIQAEDELAAAGMVIGAGWCGARSFTSTAGPGISLMGEFIGLAYYAEIPGVFFDIQRTGPSTGMPTRTQQGDLLSIAYLSHGDTKHIALFPANPEECFHLAVAAFDLSERFQTPVCVVSDLDIGITTGCATSSRGTTAIARIAAKCSAPRSSTVSRNSLATRMSTATGSPRARFPVRIHAAATSRAAPVTTRMPRTPRTPPSIWKSSIGWRGSSRRRRRLCRRRRYTISPMAPPKLESSRWVVVIPR